jgi:cell wall-associated NlpC family hydrolase
MAVLDPRLHAYRADLDAATEKGRVEAARFVDGTLHQIAEPQTAIRREPSHEAALDTQALLGERITVYDINDEGWAWGQLQTDGHVGWLSANALGRIGAPPTHTVTALRALAFPGPDIKLPPAAALPFGALVVVIRQDARFATLDNGWSLPSRHVAPVKTHELDIVVVAERFLHTPYLWGGKTNLGIDCSGLVQVALQATGRVCPRDSDLQETALGQPVPLTELRRGDLVFWKGHVAIARDGDTLLHANAHHMAVAIEPVREAVARIKAASSEITSVRRIG